ncbi:MAG: TetR/AcrR family transcriptional regulator [Myxococcales bacterium]|nr:TetR/AcrR family transcriptional regulator [Myxococcales bacterium]
MTDDKLDTKQKILAAAEAEFLVHGHAGSRMQAIADRAEINKAMLHYHFRSKDELFAQVFRDKAGLLFPKIQASFRDRTDLIAFTCTFVDLYVAHLIEHPFLPFYLLQVSATHSDLLKQVARDFPQRFAAAFRAAARAGQVREHDPIQFITSLIGMCVMPFVGRHLFKHLFELDEPAYQAFLRRRADELKRYVVLLLTPGPGPTEER